MITPIATGSDFEVAYEHQTMTDCDGHDLIAKKSVLSVGYIQKFDSKSMRKIAGKSDPSKTGLLRSSVLTPISIDTKTCLHKNSAERAMSEVSSQYLVRVVPWRCNKDSYRIHVPSKPYLCPELYTAEVCDVPVTGYVRMKRHIHLAANMQLCTCNPNSD